MQNHDDLSSAFCDGYKLRPLIPIKWALLIAMLIAFTAANAQTTTYMYMGKIMTGTYEGQFTSPSGASYTTLFGTITLSAPLPANATNFVVTPVAYSFNNDNLLTAPNNGTNVTNVTEFSFTTDGNGMITGWNIVVNFSEGYTSEDLSLVGGTGDTFSFSNVTIDCQNGFMGGCTYWNASNKSNGTWSVPQAASSAVMTAQVETLKTQLATANATAAQYYAESVANYNFAMSYVKAYKTEYVVQENYINAYIAQRDYYAIAYPQVYNAWQTEGALVVECRKDKGNC